MEQRNSIRFNVEYKSSATINGCEYPCVIRNFSLGGASLQFSAEHLAKSPKKLSGQKVIFPLRGRFLSTQNSYCQLFQGTVVRQINCDDRVFLAVQFY